MPRRGELAAHETRLMHESLESEEDRKWGASWVRREVQYLRNLYDLPHKSVETAIRALLSQAFYCHMHVSRTAESDPEASAVWMSRFHACMKEVRAHIRLMAQAAKQQLERRTYKSDRAIARKNKASSERAKAQWAKLEDGTWIPKRELKRRREKLEDAFKGDDE